MDASNKALNPAQGVALTANISRLFPCEAYVSIAGERHKAMADPIVTVNKQRLFKRVGKLSSDHMKALENVIKTQLGLR